MSTDTLNQWAQQWGVPAMALLDLRRRLGEVPGEGYPVLPGPGESTEARIQADIRLRSPQFNMTLWRNNVGALKDERGVPIRYGLANDTKALNKIMKSGDLIGWYRRTILAEHVGQVIAQFVSIEAKRPGWQYNPSDEHQVAQARWRDLVIAQGGIACFSTGGFPQC